MGKFTQKIHSTEKTRLVVEQAYTRIKEKLKEVDGVVEKISALRAELVDVYGNQKVNNDKIASLEKEINQKGYDRDKLTQSISVLDNNIIELQNKKAEYMKNRGLYDVASILLRDSGIKTSVIQNYIPEFNRLINKYLADMDFYTSFELDENFSETIKSRHRDDFSYNSFSAGERQRIDLAILFTWREIAKARNSMTSNLTIYDEVLDASLDASGVQDLMKIFPTMDKESIFVISHNQIMENEFDKVIRVEKKFNFSEIS